MSSSLKSIKYEYEHCISSINGSISIDIYAFGGRKSKKPQGGQYVNEVRFHKKIGFPIFLAKDKNLTPRQVEILKWPKKGLPYCVLISKHPAYEFCLFNVKKTALVCTTTKRKDTVILPFKTEVI